MKTHTYTFPNCENSFCFDYIYSIAFCHPFFRKKRKARLFGTNKPFQLGLYSLCIFETILRATVQAKCAVSTKNTPTESGRSVWVLLFKSLPALWPVVTSRQAWRSFCRGQVRKSRYRRSCTLLLCRWSSFCCPRFGYLHPGLRCRSHGSPQSI